MRDRIYTVYELNCMVKEYLEDIPVFKDFFLTGEVSNITYYKSGHLYFTLKDEKASVKCVAFYYKYKKIPEDLKEGDSVKIFGQVTLYENTGNYQILVSHLQKEQSLGKLFEELEKLKKQLSAKGYFDESRKKRLPLLPKTVGIVTSPTGAAIKDIMSTGKERFPNINFILYPAKVQGEGSIKDIVEGIRVLNEIPEVDVIIAGRGGGSIEDLWSFNFKEVAYAFLDSKKPIVSAVGHEIDVLLTDFIADARAATPTHASEMVIPRKEKLLEELYNKSDKIKKMMENRLKNKKNKLNTLKNSHVIKNFSSIIEEKNRDLVILEEKMNYLVNNLLDKKSHLLELKRHRLLGVNPKEVLKRGYTITLKNGKVVKDKNTINNGDEIESYFYNGAVKSIVKE